MFVKISEDFKFEFGNNTDVGNVREVNEDYLGSFASDFGYVFVLCDGMGGHAAGEVASQLTVDTIKKYVTEQVPQGTATKEIIQNSLDIANTAIFNESDENTERSGMGSTCSLLFIKKNLAYFGNVGDSRIYLIRNKKIYQLSKDQTFVQTLVDQGLISYDEAENHPRKNEILQALGVTRELTPQISDTAISLYRNDVIVLCSDGLSGLVNDEQIMNVSLNNSPMEATLRLTQLAKDNGGYDNITVQIVKVVKGLEPAGDKAAVPVYAVDKLNVAEKKVTLSEDFKKTRELGHYPVGRPKRKISKSILFASFGFTAVLAMIFYFAIIKEKLDRNNFTKNDTTQNKDTSVNESQELTEGDVGKFLSDLYSRDYKPDSNEKIVFAERITYVGSDRKTYQWTLEEFNENTINNSIHYENQIERFVNQSNPIKAEYRVVSKYGELNCELFINENEGKYIVTKIISRRQTPDQRAKNEVDKQKIEREKNPTPPQTRSSTTKQTDDQNTKSNETKGSEKDNTGVGDNSGNDKPDDLAPSR